MKKLAVIGDPINHSLSPKLHNFWLKKYNIDGEYKALRIDSKNLEKEVTRIIEDGYIGFNITIPHKERIKYLCDEVSEESNIIGAINTVHINNEGIIKGYNTDCLGFYRNILDNLSENDNLGKSALIIGCGGASRAIIYSLYKNNFKNIFITNRTKEKADNLKSDIDKYIEFCDIEVIKWEEKDNYLPEADLVVNTTSLGMGGNNNLEISMDGSKKSTIFTDIVYTPLETNFLKRAKYQGNKIIDGLGMFLYQASYSFGIWFGVTPEVDKESRDLIINELNSRK